MTEESNVVEGIVVGEENDQDGGSEVGSEDSSDFGSMSEILEKFGGERHVMNSDNSMDYSSILRPRDSSVSTRTIQSQLGELSLLASSENELKTDVGIMARLLEDVGSHGYGLQGVSVWQFDQDDNKLVPKGWWHSPSMPKSEALDRLFDPSRVDHVPQKAVLPGADLAGILWNEASGYDMAGKGTGKRSLNPGENLPEGRRSMLSEQSTSRRSSLLRASSISFGRRGSSFGSNRRSQLTRQSAMASMRQLFVPSTEGEINEGLKWRDIESLVSDPYTAKGPRLALLEKAGFHRAAGITYKNEIFRGIVVYYIKSGLDEDILDSLANTSYLKQSAQMIGCGVSMVTTRRATVGHTVRKLSCVPQAMDDDASLKESKIRKNLCHLVPRRVKKLTKKAKGGGMQIPPAPSASHAIWTTAGAFCGLLVASSLNQYFRYLSNDELFLILGPFGALITLQYGLTAAPASQPRNAIIGQAIAGAASMLFTYIPESILSVWLRQAIAPAIAIGLMVKCGFTHPPAGAHAVIMASGKYNWAFYGIALLATVISIVPAMIINNLSDRRQYPTYWFEFSESRRQLFKKSKNST